MHKLAAGNTTGRTSTVGQADTLQSRRKRGAEVKRQSVSEDKTEQFSSKKRYA